MDLLYLAVAKYKSMQKTSTELLHHSHLLAVTTRLLAPTMNLLALLFGLLAFISRLLALNDVLLAERENYPFKSHKKKGYLLSAY